MAGTVMPAPKFIGLDNNANPVSGGKLYTYVAGTTTPQATYSDVDLTVANTNPVELDAAGRATVFLSGASYKFVLADANDVAIWTQDNVQAVAPFSTNLDVLGTAGEAILAGQACYLSDGSGGKTAGKWYLADADNAYASSLPQIAMAPDAVAQDASGTFRLQGAATKANTQAAFVVGSTYYVAGGASKGLLSLTPGTNQRIMGQADSTTTIVISPNPPNVAVTPTFVNGVTVTSTDGGATAGPYLDLYRDSASPAASDQIGEVRLSGEDSAGNKQLYARIYGQIADPTSTSEDGQVRVSVVSNGTETLMLVLTESGAFLPDLTTQDLGSGAKPWRNVFLSGTGKLDFGNGDVTVTASANTLTWAGASSGYIFNDGNLFVRSSATTGSNSWGTGQIKVEQDTFTGITCVTHNDTDGNAGFMQILRSRGTQASPTAVTSTQYIGAYNWSAYDGVNAAYRTVAEIQSYVDGTVSSGVVPGSLRFAVANSSGTLVERLRITSGGNVGIGATAKLYLDGVAGTGDTYIHESSANRIAFVVGGIEMFVNNSAVALNLSKENLGVEATKKFYLDGGGDTYIAETASNTLRLYAGGVDTLILQPDGLYIGIMPTTASAANLVYNTGTARVERSTSSIRYKHDISTLDTHDALSAVMAMRPVTYRGKTDDDQRRFVGFIAEEVQEIAPLLCTYDEGGESGTPNYVTYDRVTAYLVAVVQQQQSEINALKARIH